MGVAVEISRARPGYASLRGLASASSELSSAQLRENFKARSLLSFHDKGMLQQFLGLMAGFHDPDALGYSAQQRVGDGIGMTGDFFHRQAVAPQRDRVAGLGVGLAV